MQISGRIPFGHRTMPSFSRAVRFPACRCVFAFARRRPVGGPQAPSPHDDDNMRRRGSEGTKNRLCTNSSSSSRRKKSSDQSKRKNEALGNEAIGSKPRGIAKQIFTPKTPTRAAEEDSKQHSRTDTEMARSHHATGADRDKPSSDDQKRVFDEFARDALAKGIAGILAEYHTDLAPYIPPMLTRRAFDANPDKNRYADVVCGDQTRVVLKPSGGGGGDYIHANYVRGGPLLNTFILTQGPTLVTVKDFWRMIVQESVGNIIMLCDTIEVGKEKCQQYWPREEGCSVEWPGIQVRNVKVDNSDSTTVMSVLEVTIGGRERLTLKHHHWRTWPDKSVPASVLAPFRVLKSVRHNSKPTVVHCSAGIGRTGSVVALEVCFQTLLSEQPLNVLDMVKWLRQQRMHSVQTDMQYLYLYKCIITLATKYRLVPPECQTLQLRFDEEYQKMIDEKTKGEKKELYAPLVFTRRRAP